MDGDRFDELTRALGALKTRRGALRAAIVGLVGTAASAVSYPEAFAKKKNGGDGDGRGADGGGKDAAGEEAKAAAAAGGKKGKGNGKSKGKKHRNNDNRVSQSSVPADGCPGGNGVKICHCALGNTQNCQEVGNGSGHGGVGHQADCCCTNADGSPNPDCDCSGQGSSCCKKLASTCGNSSQCCGYTANNSPVACVDIDASQVGHCCAPGQVWNTGAGTCCTPDSVATTCKGRCGVITNNCGKTVDCGNCPSDSDCIDHVCVPKLTCAQTCTGCCAGETCNQPSDGACGINGAACVACSDGAPHCNTATGTCVQCLNDGQCDDQDVCTTDRCNAQSICQHTQIPCDAKVCQTNAGCDPKNGCQYTFDEPGTTCDGGVCDGVGHCVQCVSNAQCDDQNACTTDTCDAAKSICVHTPVTCEPKICKIASCNPATGCEYVNEEPGEICPTGVCDGKGNCVQCIDERQCDDKNACTTDTCDAAKNICVHTPKDCPKAGICQAGGGCDPVSGCQAIVNQPIGTLCPTGVCDGDGHCVECNSVAECTDGTLCEDAACIEHACSYTPRNCNDGNSCTNDRCDDSNGICVHTPVENGTLCTNGACCDGDCCETGNICVLDAEQTGHCCPSGKPFWDGEQCVECLNDGQCKDGNGCTVDICLKGHCEHTLIPDCRPCADDSACGSIPVGQCEQAVCDMAKGFCVVKVRPDGTTCNDGDLCTRTDTCQAGVCTGSNPVVCKASDQCHDAGTCNPATGICSNPAKEDGATCDDGNLCTQTDTCQAGVCTGSNPVVCKASDQCHDAGTCNPATGICSNPNKANGTACDDGNACTQTDTCQAGVCTGSNPVVCEPLDQCHDVGICDTETGACSNPAKEDGTTCNDGNACTQTDTCQAGTCVGGNPVVCTASDQCHDAGICDTETGICSNPAKEDGTTCDDGNACTQTDTCQAGACVGGNPVICTASDQCHVAGTCDPKTGTCSNPEAADGTTCDDGNACTRKDICQAGVCTGTDPVICTPSDQCHDAGTCDPQNGTCSNPAKPAGTTCNDGDRCTSGDVCQVDGTCAGTIIPGCLPCETSANCSTLPAETCKKAVCGENFTCESVIDAGAACDDGNACTTNDICGADGLCAGTPLTGVSCGAETAGCCSEGTCDDTLKVCNEICIPSSDCCADAECVAPPICQQGGTCANGACAYTPVTNGTACESGIGCCNGACITTSCPEGLVYDFTTCSCLAQVCIESGGACAGTGQGVCCDGLTCCGEQCVDPTCPTGQTFNATTCSCQAGTCIDLGGTCSGTGQSTCCDGLACSGGVCKSTTCAGKNKQCLGDLLPCCTGFVCSTTGNETYGICETPPQICAQSGEDCTTISCCKTGDTCQANGQGDLICQKAVEIAPCGHAGERPSGGRCCERLHLEQGHCVINRWDHCDPRKRGKASFCERGTRCIGGRVSPHGTPVCVPSKKRRGRGSERTMSI